MKFDDSKLVKLNDEVRDFLHDNFGKMQMGMVQVGPSISVPDTKSLVSLLGRQQTMLLDLRRELMVVSAFCRAMGIAFEEESESNLVDAMCTMVRAQMEQVGKAAEEMKKERAKPKIVLPGDI